MTRSRLHASDLETNVSMRGIAIVVPPGGLALSS
jgi:hypothetical protein